MTICYFGDYDPEYNRVRTILKGLEKLGVKVIHCNAPDGSKRHYWPLIKKLWSLRGQYDVIVVGMSNSRIMPIFAKLFGNKPVIWDALYSLWDNRVHDRQLVSPYSLGALQLWIMDYLGAWFADVTFLDVQHHADYYSSTFHLPKHKFAYVLVGADTDVFAPLPKNKELPYFEVEFHGKYIPLQGTPFIVQAAKLLENDNVHFTMIGAGQEEKAAKAIAEKLEVKNVTFLPFMPQSEITEYVRNADICLGMLGNVPRVVRSIPNKFYEVAAMARVCVNVDTVSLREVFTPDVDAIAVKLGDPEDLARKIREVKERGNALEMGQRAYETFLKTSTPTIVAQSLLDIIKTKTGVTL